MGSGGKHPAGALALPLLVCGICGSYLLLRCCLQDPCSKPCGVETHNALTFIKVFILYYTTIIPYY